MVGRFAPRVNQASTSPLISLVVVSEQLNHNVDFESLIIHLLGLLKRGGIPMEDKTLPETLFTAHFGDSELHLCGIVRSICGIDNRHHCLIQCRECKTRG